MRTSARAVVDASMSERQLLQAIVDLATLRRWGTYHTHDSRHSAAGFPDLTMVRGRRLIFAELKTEKGRLTTDQRAWLEALALTSAEVYCWRPSSWPEIEATLR